MLDTFEVLRAVAFAEAAHRGTMRRYTTEPYIVHPIAVATTISVTSLHASLQPHRVAMISAALLHDVVEDTPVTTEEIMSTFGEQVGLYVKALTDTPKAYGNRKARKERDRLRLSLSGDAVKTIKCADILDNMSSILEYDPDFAKVFLKEIGELIPCIEPSVHSSLFQQLVKTYNDINIKGVYNVKSSV